MKKIIVESKTLSEIDWDYVFSQGETHLYSYKSLSIYPYLELLTVSSHQNLLGIWPIPYTWENERKIARREVRLLPYHPPLIFKNHLVDTRKVLTAFLTYLKENYYAIDLPLAPRFYDLALFSASGMSIEWRNTHHFSKSHMLTENLHPKVKNHIRCAEKKVTIEWDCPFDFERGIVTDNPIHLSARKKLAIELLKSGRGRVLTALNNKEIEGQAVVVHDARTAYLFHSWFKKQGIRGVPSYLIETASNWALNEQDLEYFDLEGSIIPAVDRFFSNFGGLQAPYAYVQWCKHKHKMLEMIENTLFLALRLEEEKCLDEKDCKS